MSVRLVAEVSATSKSSFEDAINGAIEEAKNNGWSITSVWVKEQRVKVESGLASEYQVNLLVTYLPVNWKPRVM